MILSGEPTSFWIWKSAPEGELVPDHPPMDVTQQIKSVEMEIEFPGEDCE